MADDSRPLLVMRRGDRLFPLAPLDAEALMEFPAGKPLRARLTQPRNVGRLRLYWAMLGLIRENLDSPPPAKALHDAIKVRLGFFTIVPFKNGVEKVADSVAFDEMTEERFREFLEAFKTLVREQVIPGISKPAFEKAALEMLGDGT